jgi:enolase-phosphatase E1
MIKYVLTDIEGTTTDIAFVHKVLFPYAYEKLPDFIRSHLEDTTVQRCLTEVKETILAEKQMTADIENSITQLLLWIETDRKHPALKYLQGLIWEEGYKNNSFKGHIYPDVVPQIKLWRSKGIGVGIYSSGSVGAQQLLFGYSDYGDLNDSFDHNFDTSIGHKREVSSYENIANHLKLSPQQILFLSDVEAELDAARLAGYQTVQLVRAGTASSSKHTNAADFHGINL